MPTNRTVPELLAAPPSYPFAADIPLTPPTSRATLRNLTSLFDRSDNRPGYSGSGDLEEVTFTGFVDILIIPAAALPL